MSGARVVVASGEWRRAASRLVVLAGLLAVLAVFAPGCADESGSGSNVRLGQPPPGTGPSAGTATAAIVVYGVRVVSPAWFPVADDQALADAVREYLDDASAALGGWLPQPGNGARFPLTVILHDVQGAEYWSEVTRTAWLSWPRGPSRRPLQKRFAPLLHTVMVLDRRRELGLPGQAWTQQEADCAVQGRGLLVVLRTVVPGVYD